MRCPRFELSTFALCRSDYRNASPVYRSVVIVRSTLGSSDFSERGRALRRGDVRRGNYAEKDF